ncbi:MAG: hypothetical protein EHM87_15020 [Burkholderiales bacterium]|nr:MAG: hypothetical protein EHM87_15020 [Burkholderiales bacterium]
MRRDPPGRAPPDAPPPRPTDWRARLRDGATPRLTVLEADFAGIPAGSTLFVPTPGLLADRITALHAGETLEPRALRDALARAEGADATCPVTTGLFLRIVAEAAWDDLQDGTPVERIIPFWRVIDPASPVAARLRCGPEWIRAIRAREAAAPPMP